MATTGPEYWPDEDEDQRYPVGEMFDCYACVPMVGMKQKCVGLGPVTAQRFDPTQTYRLECGHLAI